MHQPPAPALAPPLAVTGSAQAWPLHDSARTRAWEAHALAQQAPTGALAGPSRALGPAEPPALPSPSALMQAAGQATARLALALAPHAPLFQVHVGPGNNGGDGWVAATALHQHGRRVQVVDCSEGRTPPEDAGRARAWALRLGVPCTSEWDAPTQRPPGSLVVDALLGLGAQVRHGGRLQRAIGDVRQAADEGHTVLAVDLPTGLHPDTGQATSGLAVQAHHTLSLLTLKPGLFTGQGRDHAGQVWLHPLGSRDPGEASGTLNGRPAPAPRRHAQHKGSFGDVAVLGGAAGMGGALVLAARAALCGGAGRVFAWSLAPQAEGADPAWPELMHRQTTDSFRPGAATVVAGCGGGSAVADHLPALLSSAHRLVLDADALNAIASSPALQQALAQRPGPTVLTPHPLEAARLLGCDTAAVQADRIAAAQALAARHRCVVLLKGSGTVLAHPGGRWCINPTGNALLASAGTGDVLAGWLGGLWSATAAQRDTRDDAQALGFDAACAAAWWHGAAADTAWQRGHRQGWHASDLLQTLGDVWGRSGPAG
ncbi:MAG: NAD(P)H-hydrate dehydratase [Rubrivivax sp.]